MHYISKYSVNSGKTKFFNFVNIFIIKIIKINYFI